MAKPTLIEKDGRRYYRVRIRRPTKGINVDEYFPTKRAAEALIREIDLGRTTTKSNATADTLSGLADAYLNEPFLDRKKRPLKPSVVKDRRVRVNVLRRLFGDMRLKHMTPETIDARLSSAGWGSVNRYRYEVALSRMLAFAKQRGMVAENIMTRFERAENVDRKCKRTYTSAEWTALLDAADASGGMIGFFLRLAWATGCRKGELLALRWADVSLVDDREGIAACVYIRDPKNRQPRTVFLRPTIYRLLLAHEQEYRRSSDPKVFPSRLSSTLYSADAPFQDARATAGLDGPDDRYGENLTIHAIR